MKMYWLASFLTMCFRKSESKFLLLFFPVFLFVFITPVFASSASNKMVIKPLPSEAVYRLATKAYSEALQHGINVRKHLLTIVDYSLPSNVERFWVIDLEKRRVLEHTLVAHGINSGLIWPSKFSNASSSLQSSIGLYQTENSYFGEHGYSMRIKGLEPSFNDNAEKRAVVVHGAPYVSHSFMVEHGRIGRSWGCITVDANLAPKIIDQIKNGSLIFVYYPDRRWLASSRFLHEQA